MESLINKSICHNHRYILVSARSSLLSRLNLHDGSSAFNEEKANHMSDIYIAYFYKKKFWPKACNLIAQLLSINRYLVTQAFFCNSKFEQMHIFFLITKAILDAEISSLQ